MQRNRESGGSTPAKFYRTTPCRTSETKNKNKNKQKMKCNNELSNFKIKLKEYRYLFDLCCFRLVSSGLDREAKRDGCDLQALVYPGPLEVI